MEENCKGNQKLFCRTLKCLRKEKECPLKFFKERNGVLIAEKENILERWREYFNELLEGNLEEDIELEIRDTYEIRDQEEEQITPEELQIALKENETRKSARL